MPFFSGSAWIPWSLAPDQWAALFIVLIVIIACAWIDYTQFRVPNNITFPLILSGWLYGFVRGYLATPEGAPPHEMVLWPLNIDLMTMSAPWANACDGFLGAFKLTFLGIGFPLLILFYAIGGMGAGDCKMQMGFGSWCATIFGYPLGFVIVFYSFCFAALVGGAIAVAMIWWMGSWMRNKENFKAIFSDWMTSKSIKEIGDKAEARKPTMPKLPYGVPLCIGFLSFLALDYFGVWARFFSSSQ